MDARNTDGLENHLNLSEEKFMTKAMYKSVFAVLLTAGILLTSVAPTALAQGTGRSRNTRSVVYDDRDYDYQRDRTRRSRDYGYENDPYYDYDRDRNRSRNDGLKRTGIGAAIGAAGGGLMGGRKGVLIGGLIGAAGGYIYHRQKDNRRR